MFALTINDPILSLWYIKTKVNNGVCVAAKESQEFKESDRIKQLPTSFIVVDPASEVIENWLNWTNSLVHHHQ